MTHRLKAILLLSCGLLASSPAPAQDAETIYKQRLEKLLTGAPLDTLYQPLEAVPGAATLTALPQASAAQRTITDTALADAAAYAADSKAAAFIVWHKGKLQAEIYGDGVTAATPLPSKSLSKPMTAIVIGRALQLGLIKSLDQPVADFVTEWQGTPKAAMLIRHLLDMRTGFLEQGFNADPDHPWNRAYLSTDHGSYIVKDYPLTDAPGSRYGYSNATSELVALVIERASKRRYADFVGQEVLAPVGAPGGQVWVNRVGGLAHSGCCMMVPAEVWLRLAILLLHDGVADGKRLLPAGYVKQMVTGTPQNPHYGLGVWLAGSYVERRGFGAPGAPGPSILHSEPYLDRDLYLFDGNGSQTVFISPQTGLIALRLGNNPPKGMDWDNSRLPNILIRGLKDKVKTEPQPR
ncbi:serine hydrolase [Niveispirillum sp. SYP-B3756]|uniref:serine hydrolase domain-containing protein n=1 Tax=Niveispirillum sp. SYP-B3756 TaxID=2662178 RepID=UPI001290B15F|nr:serine hydrolase [Niveispirillum sp. SYP-B3756]MQP66567.1 serine hydrolase [Niveispirillum sp. SYP-B3756]